MIGFSKLTDLFSLVVVATLFAAEIGPTPVLAEAQHTDPKPGITVTNRDPPFTLSLPPRYVQVKSVGDALCTFRTTDETTGAVVAVYRLGHTVEPGSLDISNFKGADARRIQASWKSRPLDAFAWHTTSKDGMNSAVRWSQIPLEPQAVSIVVLIPAEKEQLADGLFADFLNGIDGPTNWPLPIQLTRAERAARIALGLAVLLATLAAPVAAVIALRRRRVRNQDPSPARLTLLAASLSSPEPEKLTYWVKVFAITFALIGVVLAYLSLFTLGVALASEQSFGATIQGLMLILNLVLIMALAATSFYLMKSVHRRGQVVVDFGPDRLRTFFWAIAILCLIAASVNGFSALQNLSRSHGTIGPWNSVSLAALMLGMVPQFVIRACGRMQLTEQGIFQNCHLLRWEKVDFVRWLDDLAILEVKGNGPLLLKLPVPAELKQTAEELLARRGITPRRD
jgi:MFS family permease